MDRRLPSRPVGVGIALAVVGLYLLTGADVALGRGVLLTLACAVLFAFHIVCIGAYVSSSGAGLACVTIPGCAGKGIIDLVALYPDGKLDAMRDTIDALGFQPQRTGHPFPADRPMRVGAIEHRGQVYRLHMHVVAANSDEAQSLYRFRDVLRADSSLRDAYQAKKCAILQSGVNSSNDYTQAKGDFIGAVLSRSLR